MLKRDAEPSGLCPGPALVTLGSAVMWAAHAAHVHPGTAPGGAFS